MRRERLVVVTATSECGLAHSVGPFDLAEAQDWIDSHMRPAGWAPKIVSLTPTDIAARVFEVGRKFHTAPGPGELNLFVALRRAILCDPENDGADCDRGAAITAHLEAHRPLPLVSGNEECVLGECCCDRVDGKCPNVKPAEPICQTCSAMYDSGSEWSPEWIEACRVPWPCPPLRAAAAHYKIDVESDERVG